MSTLSLNEIKTRAIAFSKEWEHDSYDDAEVKSFWDEFFQALGISRKRVAIFFLIFCPSIISGQKLTTEYSINNGVWFGLSYSPELGFRRLINTEGTAYLDEVIQFRDSLETPRWGYTTGLTFLFPFKELLAIETGLQYSNTRFMRIQNSTDSTPSPDQLIKQTSFFNYHYVNFPLRLKLILGGSRVRLIAGIGISANAYLKDIQCHTYDYNNGTSEEKKGGTPFAYHKFNLSTSISLGIMYQVNRQLVMIVEPIFRYGLTQTVKQPISNYLYSGGVNMSILFHK